MSDIALRTVGLGKMYRIGGEREKYRTLRDTLAQAAKRPLERIRHPGAATHVSRELWALKNIDLEVKHGEVLGIIGRNGAGKSTLLKVLSHITEPTEGRAEIGGRVASLLEVGTGFHAELTGRENIQLNGAILGMTRAEIKSRFDEIVEFSEIGRFLDTPVKRYSSGMYVRLAFAVAAHLEPEILLVDEVLAVGDASFQKKCLGKMSDVAHGGRTVLFVSHNMASLAAICQTAVVLDSGTAVFRGGIGEGIDHYLGEMSARQTCVHYEPAADCDVQFKKAEMVDAEGRALEVFSLSLPITIRIEYDVPRQLERVQIVCHLWNSHGVHVLTAADIDGQPKLLEGRAPGSYVADITVPPWLLGPGTYQVSVACGVPNLRLIDDREGPTFEVSAMHSHAAQWSVGRQGVVVALPLAWKTTRVLQGNS